VRIVAVDGGMATTSVPPCTASLRGASPPNVRPRWRRRRDHRRQVCESGDYLIRDARPPRLREGEVLAIPASGAILWRWPVTITPPSAGGLRTRR
jgi:diaminopimelate decarboxylase